MLKVSGTDAPQLDGKESSWEQLQPGEGLWEGPWPAGRQMDYRGAGLGAGTW